MKIKQRLFLITTLFWIVQVNAQNLTPSFTSTLSPTGVVTLSNTSVPPNSINPIAYIWNTGNGMSYTTTTVSQTISSTYTMNGYFTIILTAIYPNNQSFSISQTLTVSISGCSLWADMVADSAIPFAQTVKFTSLSTGTTSGTNYSWLFSDGATLTGLSPTRLFSGIGAYTYTLIASNSPTCNSIKRSEEIFPWYVAICNGFTPSISYTSGLAGSTIFTINAEHGNDQIIWDFGDVYNAWGYAYSPNWETWLASNYHTYFNGTYSITVSMLNGFCHGNGYTNAYSTITVTNHPCNANAAFTYTPGTSGSVLFSKTAPSTNTNIVYSWYFGDGVSSTLVSPTHNYSSSGNYTVILISTDVDSYPLNDPLDTIVAPCKSFSLVNLNITGIPCIANSNFNIQPSGMPQSYWITPVYPYNVVAATWNWGDGSTSNFLYAYHTYSAAGSYDICLTVTTSCGASSSNCVSQYLSKGQSGDMVYVSVMPSAISNGINENSLVDDLLQVFPNPTNGAQLTVKLSEGFNKEKIGIYDLVGKEVAELAVPENEVSLKIDVSGLNTGLYFLRVKSSRSGKTLKFIVTRE